MLRSAGPAFLLGLLRRSNIPNHNIVLSIWMQSRVEEQQFSTAERPSAQSSSATAARTRERLPTPSSTRRLKKDSRNFNYAPYTSPHAASRSGQRAGCPPKGLKPNTSRSRKAKGEPPFYFLCLYSQCPSAPSIPKLTVVVKPGYRISPGHFLGQPQSGFLGGQVGEIPHAGGREQGEGLIKGLRALGLHPCTPHHLPSESNTGHFVPRCWSCSHPQPPGKRGHLWCCHREAPAHAVRADSRINA